MGKVSRSLLLQYNKCAALATRYSNILDSFWHKDDKIPLSSLKTDPKTYIVEGSDNVNLKGDGTADSPIEIYVNEVDISNKVDKVSGKGLSANDYTSLEKQKLAQAMIKILIKDENGVSKFEITDALRFGSGFLFDAIQKKISYSPTSSLWLDGTLIGGGTGYFKYRRVGNRVVVRVDLSSYATSSGYEPYCNIGTLPAELRPSEEVTRAVFGYTGYSGPATGNTSKNLGVRVFAYGAVLLTLGVVGSSYTFDFEFTLNN